MSRTASFSSVSQPVPAHWILLMLISCLALHFFLEDSLLLAASESIHSEFSEQLYEEATHQDDAAAPVRLLERIKNYNLPAPFSLTVPFPRQASSPIFPPPKID
jgi:hypothetical protein